MERVNPALFTPVATALENLAVAVSHVDSILGGSGVLSDPEGPGKVLSCTETEALVDLFRAVGLDVLADDLLGQHVDHDSEEDDYPEHIALRDARRAEEAADDPTAYAFPQ